MHACTYQPKENQAAILCQAAQVLVPVRTTHKIQDHVNTSWRNSKDTLDNRDQVRSLLKVAC